MPKLVIRIVTLVLVPCLIADPLTASGLKNPLSLGERVGVRGDIFAHQALAAAAGLGGHPSPRMGRAPLTRIVRLFQSWGLGVSADAPGRRQFLNKLMGIALLRELAKGLPSSNAAAQAKTDAIEEILLDPARIRERAIEEWKWLQSQKTSEVDFKTLKGLLKDKPKFEQALRLRLLTNQYGRPSKWWNLDFFLEVVLPALLADARLLRRDHDQVRQWNETGKTRPDRHGELPDPWAAALLSLMATVPTAYELLATLRNWPMANPRSRLPRSVITAVDQLIAGYSLKQEIPIEFVKPAHLPASQGTAFNLAQIATIPQNKFQEAAERGFHLLVRLKKDGNPVSPAPLRGEGVAISAIVFRVVTDLLFPAAAVAAGLHGVALAVRLAWLTPVAWIATIWLRQLGMLVQRDQGPAELRAKSPPSKFWFLPVIWLIVSELLFLMRWVGELFYLFERGEKWLLSKEWATTWIIRAKPGSVLPGIIIDDTINDLIHFDRREGGAVRARSAFCYYRSYVQFFLMIHELWGHGFPFLLGRWLVKLSQSPNPVVRTGVNTLFFAARMVRELWHTLPNRFTQAVEKWGEAAWHVGGGYFASLSIIAGLMVRVAMVGWKEGVFWAAIVTGIWIWSIWLWAYIMQQRQERQSGLARPRHPLRIGGVITRRWRVRLFEPVREVSLFVWSAGAAKLALRAVMDWGAFKLKLPPSSMGWVDVFFAGMTFFSVIVMAVLFAATHRWVYRAGKVYGRLLKTKATPKDRRILFIRGILGISLFEFLVFSGWKAFEAGHLFLAWHLIFFAFGVPLALCLLGNNWPFFSLRLWERFAQSGKPFNTPAEPQDPKSHPQPLFELPETLPTSAQREQVVLRVLFSVREPDDLKFLHDYWETRKQIFEVVSSLNPADLTGLSDLCKVLGRRVNRKIAERFQRFASERGYANFRRLYRRQFSPLNTPPALESPKTDGKPKRVQIEFEREEASPEHISAFKEVARSRKFPSALSDAEGLIAALLHLKTYSLGAVQEIYRRNAEAHSPALDKRFRHPGWIKHLTGALKTAKIVMKKAEIEVALSPTSLKKLEKELLPLIEKHRSFRSASEATNPPSVSDLRGWLAATLETLEARVATKEYPKNINVALNKVIQTLAGGARSTLREIAKTLEKVEVPLAAARTVLEEAILKVTESMSAHAKDLRAAA